MNQLSQTENGDSNWIDLPACTLSEKMVKQKQIPSQAVHTVLGKA